MPTLTSNSIAITFARPNGLPFRFSPGQYVVLSRKIGRKKVSRCYSICSSPTSGELQVGIKRVPGGKLSNALIDGVQVGQRIEVAGPFGDFSFQPTDPSLGHTFIAGGSGITPILSMLSAALEEGYQNLHLLYGCRGPEEVMFRQELETLHAQYPTTFRYTLSFDLLHQERQFGILSKQPQAAYYYLCGPGHMMEASQQALAHLGISSEHIISEAFAPTAPVLSGTPHQVRVAGQSFEVYTSETILAAAERQGVELPHACGMGQCGSCKLKLVQGEVGWKTQAQTALLPHEKAAGYVLSCVYQPVSAEVVLAEV